MYCGKIPMPHQLYDCPGQTKTRTMAGDENMSAQEPPFAFILTSSCRDALHKYFPDRSSDAGDSAARLLREV